MGIYVELYHGRSNPDVNMEAIGWGSQGPIFGPYDMVQKSYNSHIRMLARDDIDEFLYAHEDMIWYDGVYYGEVAFHDCIKVEDTERIERYDRAKAVIRREGKDV